LVYEQHIASKLKDEIRVKISRQKDLNSYVLNFTDIVLDWGHWSNSLGSFDGDCRSITDCLIRNTCLAHLDGTYRVIGQIVDRDSALRYF